MTKRVITRNILILSLVSFLTDMSSEMLYPIMPLFFSGLGLSAVSIGIIEGIAEAVAGVSKSFFGHLGDRLGRPEWFVRLGYSLSAFTKPFLGFFTGTAAFIGIRSADRLGKGIRSAPRDAILAQESKKSVRGRVFGFHRSLDTLGAALGPLITIFIIAAFGLYDNLSRVFLFALIPGIFAVGLTFMVKSRVSKPILSIGLLRSAIMSYTSIFRLSRYSPTYRKILLALLLVGIFNSTDAYLLLRASELIGSSQLIFGFKLDNSIIVIGLYVLYNLIYAGLSFVSGIAADAKGYRNTFIFGLVSFSVAYGLFSRNIGILGLVLAFAIYGVFAAVNDAVVKAWLSKELKKNELGTGIGVANTLISLTFLISSIITGLLWQLTSPGMAFSILSIGMLLPIAYIVIYIPVKD